MDQDARKELTTLRLREKAAAFAKETVKIQMKSFKVRKYPFLSLSSKLLVLLRLIHPHLLLFPVYKGFSLSFEMQIYIQHMYMN